MAIFVVNFGRDTYVIEICTNIVLYVINTPSKFHKNLSRRFLNKTHQKKPVFTKIRVMDHDDEIVCATLVARTINDRIKKFKLHMEELEVCALK